MYQTSFYKTSFFIRLSVFIQSDRAMANPDLAQQFEDQFQDVVSRLQTKEIFRSDWDIASFAMFFIFIGEWTQWIRFPGPFKDAAELPFSSKLTFEDN